MKSHFWVFYFRYFKLFQGNNSEFNEVVWDKDDEGKKKITFTTRNAINVKVSEDVVEEIKKENGGKSNEKYFIILNNFEHEFSIYFYTQKERTSN